MKKVLLIVSFLMISLVAFSQIPDGYYDGTEGLSGD